MKNVRGLTQATLLRNPIAPVLTRTLYLEAHILMSFLGVDRVVLGGTHVHASLGAPLPGASPRLPAVGAGLAA